MKKPLASNVGGSQLFPGEERRRSQRVMIRIPVTLELTIARQKVTFRAVTVSVNDHGAMVLCPRTVVSGTELEMQNDQTHQKQLCRVIRTPVESQQSYLLPMEFVSSAPGFWQISFPPVDWKPPED